MTDLTDLLRDREPGKTLPREFYVDRGLYEEELSRVFHANWLFAGHTCKIQDPGDYFLLPVGEEELIVLRDKGGNVRAHFNVCRHRGSRIATEPRGRSRSLVCPYHQWAYKLDGCLANARLMGEGFDADEYRLRSAAVRELAGLVFVCLRHDASTPDFDAELFTTGYAGLRSIHEHAGDAEHGVSAVFFTSLAHRLGLYVAYGFPERRRSGGVSDSANLIGPRGHLLTYRKRQLVRTTDEPGTFVPGREVPVVHAGGARIALVICWDLGSPEAVREAALRDADLVLVPAGWRHPWGRQYELACAARALDNAVFLASANQPGDYHEALFDTPGGVYGPTGLRVCDRTLARSVAEVDLGLPERWRSAFGNTLPGAAGTLMPRSAEIAPAGRALSG